MDIGFKSLKQSSPVTLPMELIFSCILPKLPAKSVLRFKCVFKSFLTEISSSKFNASFSEANHRLFILPGEQNTFCIYELDCPHSPPTICPYPIRSQWNAPILACSESYLLIGICPRPLESLILLNLITRIYHIIPNVYIPTGTTAYLQFGMSHCLDDEFNDDFKVVRFVKYGVHENDLWKVNVYSLRTNLWRTIECKTTTGWMDDPVLVQNHLLVMIIYDDNDCVTRIGCFDIKAERWSCDLLLPDILPGEIGSNSTVEGHYYYIGVLDGKLCFTWYDENKATYTTWVMKNYGVKSSWVKLMSLPAHGEKEVYLPIAYRKGSSYELLCISKYTRKYLWYNLREKQFTETEFDSDDVLDTRYLCHPYICKESLSNFPGGQPIHLLSNEQEVDDDNDNGDDDIGQYDNDQYSYVS